MMNRRLNGSFGPRPKVHKPSKMKSRSKLMKNSLKEVKITSQHYMNVLQDKGNTWKLINVRRPWPDNLNQPSHGWLKKPESRASSLGLINGLRSFAKNDIWSKAIPRPNNDSSRSKEDPPSLELNNDATPIAKNTKQSCDTRRVSNGSSRHKKTKKSMPSSSNVENDARSLAKTDGMLKVSLSQNNGAVSATNNIEKSNLSLHIDGVPLGKLAKPAYVGSKDDSNSTPRILNNSHSLMNVVSGCMPNLDVKDQCNKLDSMANVVLDNNQGKMIDGSPVSSMVSKFSSKKDVLTAKGKTTVDESKYIRADLSPIEGVIGGQVRKEHLSKSREVANFSLTFKGSQVIQNEQVGNNYSPTSKDLSSHHLIEESPKECINLASKNQNIILEDDDITIDDELKRKRRIELIVENPETNEDDGKDVVICMPSKKQRKFEDNSEEDGDRSVSKSFDSESAKLQYYSLLPIDKHIWSGILKIGSKEYVSMAAHLSPKSCKKVWEVSRSLNSVVKVTKLSRLEAFPMGSAALKPTHDNIALYFLPPEMRPNDGVDQLVKELIENDMVLRAVVGEAEMLILPSILLPEQHKTFKSKHYLWGVFRPRKNNVALAEEHRGADCCAREEVMGNQDVSHQHVVEEGSKVAGLNMDCEIQAPEPVERQQIEKEPSSSLAESGALNPAQVAACPTSAFMAAAAASANHVLSNSSLGVPSGAVFAFVAGETPRLKELIQELKRDGAVVIAMQGEIV